MLRQRHITTIRDHELEIVLCAAGVIAGVAFLVFGSPTPVSLIRSYPTWFRYFWYSSVLMGGIVGVTAALLPQKTASQVMRVLTLEGSALLIMVASLLGYAGAIAIIGHQVVATIYLGGWALACALRIFRISLSVKTMREEYQ
jgi:hypothetical protein